MPPLDDDNEWQDVPKKPKPGGGVAVADEWEDVAPPKGQPQTPEALPAAKEKVAQPTKFELAHVGKGYITPEQEEANKKAWGWYAPTISGLQSYGAGASNLLHQGYQGVKEAAGGIRDIASDIGSKRPLFFGGETPETESTFHKYVTAPAEAESKKAQRGDQTPLESVGHSVAAAIPFLGPLAANLAEQGGTGDVGGAIARGAGQYAGAKTIGKVAKGALPEIKVNPEAVGAKAAEALGGAEARPGVGPAVEVKPPLAEFRQKVAEKIVAPLARKPPIATMADIKFGRDPGRAIASEGLVAGSREALLEKTNGRIGELSEKIDEQLQNHPNANAQIDVEPLIDKNIDAAVKGAKKIGNQGAVSRLESLREALKTEYGSIKGTPFEMNKLKRAIGEAASDLSAFKATDPIEGSAASAMGDLYSDIKDAVNEKVPEVKELNGRVADLMGAKTGIARNIGLHANKSPFSVIGPGHLAFKALESTVGSTPVRTGVARAINLGNVEGIPEIGTRTPAPLPPPPIPPTPEELARQARATPAPPPKVASEFAREEIPSGEENEFELARKGGVVVPRQPGIAGLLPPAEAPRGLLPKPAEQMPMGEPEQGPAARIPEINIQRQPVTGRMQKVFMGTAQPEIIGRTEAGPIYEKQPPIEAAQKAVGIIPKIGEKAKGAIPEINKVGAKNLRAGDTFIDEKGDPRRVVRVNEDGTVETQDGAPKTYKDEVEMRGELNTPKSLVAQGGKFHPGKEPWEMTRDEYLASQLTPEALKSRKKQVGNLTLKQYKEQEHLNSVLGALYDHKAVPAEIFEDYPGLKPELREAEEGKISGDTESKYKDAKTGEWNPERVKEIHEPYVKMMTHDKVAEAQPTATVMMGGTASGKSTFAKPLFEKNHNLVRIEADHAKMNIPEYEEFQKSDPQNAAWRVHEESSRMAKQTMAEAVKNKLSFVYDATSAGNGGPELVQRLKDAGYKVHLRLVDVPTDFAVKEATRRATESADPANRGRFVPEEAIREVHQGAADKFLRMSKMLDDAVPGSDAHAIDNRNRDFKKFYEKEAGKPETIHDRQTFEYLKDKAAGRESVQNAPGVLRPLAEKARPEAGGAATERTPRGPTGNRGGPERGIREINVPKDLTLTELPSRTEKNWKALFFKGTDPATGTVTKMGHMEMAPESGNRVRVALSAVMDGFEGRGIGTEMYRQALDYAKEKGYKAVISDYKGGTGEYPEAIWKKLGGHEVKIAGQPAWQIDLKESKVKPMTKPTRKSTSE